jgi:hypothetical protein
MGYDIDFAIRNTVSYRERNLCCRAPSIFRIMKNSCRNSEGNGTMAGCTLGRGAAAKTASANSHLA